jgi:hypothetical protein
VDAHRWDVVATIEARCLDTLFDTLSQVLSGAFATISCSPGDLRLFRSDGLTHFSDETSDSARAITPCRSPLSTRLFP